jgi:putative ABC transport system permease protein
MPNSTFLNFLFLLLYRHRNKHVAIFIIASLIVFLLSSVMLISHALHFDLKRTLSYQPDFIIQKMCSGKNIDTPVAWIEEFSEIEGVTAAVGRVYGKYFYEPNEHHFTIVGIDLFDEQINQKFTELIDGIDIKAFLEKPNMIIGHGVKEFLDQYHFFEYYVFRPPDRSKAEVNIYQTFPKESSLVSNDMIIMDIDLARHILGINENHVTDIVLYTPNELEADNIYIKLVLKHFDTRIVQKSEIATAYENLYNYKGGLFLILYCVVLLSFVIILYQRYAMIQSSDKKEIGILRAVGWSIKDVIVLKMSETFAVALLAFLVGFIAAYLYIFYADAPLLGAIFYGHNNLPSNFKLTQVVDLQLLSQLFFFYMIPFMAAVLIPSWRAAVIDPLEAMR